MLLQAVQAIKRSPARKPPAERENPLCVLWREERIIFRTQQAGIHVEQGGILKFSFPISCEIKGNVVLPALEQNPVWRFRREDLIFHREEPQEQDIPVSDAFDFASNENNSIRGTVQLMAN